MGEGAKKKAGVTAGVQRRKSFRPLLRAPGGTKPHALPGSRAPYPGHPGLPGPRRMGHARAQGCLPPMERICALDLPAPLDGWPSPLRCPPVPVCSPMACVTAAGRPALPLPQGLPDALTAASAAGPGEENAHVAGPFTPPLRPTDLAYLYPRPPRTSASTTLAPASSPLPPSSAVAGFFSAGA